MQLHAVHRLGKPNNGRRDRPIIVRFVVREDKDTVFARRGRFREAVVDYDKVYTTLDYPKQVQKERAVLMKAMKRAKEMGGFHAKVLGRKLIDNRSSHTVEPIPKDYQE